MMRMRIFTVILALFLAINFVTGICEAEERSYKGTVYEGSPANSWAQGFATYDYAKCLADNGQAEEAKELYERCYRFMIVPYRGESMHFGQVTAKISCAYETEHKDLIDEELLTYYNVVFNNYVDSHISGVEKQKLDDSAYYSWKTLEYAETLYKYTEKKEQAEELYQKVYDIEVKALGIEMAIDDLDEYVSKKKYHERNLIIAAKHLGNMDEIKETLDKSKKMYDEAVQVVEREDKKRPLEIQDMIKDAMGVKYSCYNGVCEEGEKDFCAEDCSCADTESYNAKEKKCVPKPTPEPTVEVTETPVATVKPQPEPPMMSFSIIHVVGGIVALGILFVLLRRK